MGENQNMISALFSVFSVKVDMEILFVDDDADEAFSFKEAVQQLGEDIRVSHMNYCTEVLWLLKSRKFDMVFLRVNAEKKDGIYFLQAIRSLKELGPLPVVMYSTVQNDTYVDRYYNARANYYLQKPESINDTVKAFSKCLVRDTQRQHRVAKSAFVV